VDVTDFFNDESGVYYLMELLEGQTLAELLRKDGPLTEGRALYIGHQMADALEAAHQADVLHLDIKPSNIFLITKDGQADFAKLLDFGVARLRGAADCMDAEDHAADMGPVTPVFMAPEQATSGPVDHRADIYSLGTVLYAMAAGRPPFEAQSLAEFVHKHQSVAPTPLTRLPGLKSPVSAGCSRLVMRCLEKRPADRPQSARELRDLLAKVAEQSCGIVLVSGRPPQKATARLGWAWGWGWMGSIAALVVLVVAYFALDVGGEGESRRASGGAEGQGRGQGRGRGAHEARLVTSLPRGVTLELKSKPSGAEVFRMDGPMRLLGLTPLGVTDLKASGTMVVRLTLPGYVDKTLRVDLTLGSQIIHTPLDRSSDPMGSGPGVLRPRRRVVSRVVRSSAMVVVPPPAMAMARDTGGTVNPFE